MEREVVSSWRARNGPKNTPNWSRLNTAHNDTRGKRRESSGVLRVSNGLKIKIPLERFPRFVLQSLSLAWSGTVWCMGSIYFPQYRENFRQNPLSIACDLVIWWQKENLLMDFRTFPRVIMWISTSPNSWESTFSKVSWEPNSILLRVSPPHVPTCILYCWISWENSVHDFKTFPTRV